MFSKTPLSKVSLILSALIVAGGGALLAPALALAVSYTPGQTLNPACTPQDATCVVTQQGGSWQTSGSNSYTTGSVSVGTTTSLALLTVDSTSTVGSIIRLSNGDVGGHIYDLLSTGSANTGGAGRLDIFDRTANAARISITATGNVGIGTTSPSQALSVIGNAYLTGNLNVGDTATTRSNLGLPYASSANIATLSSPIAAWGDSLTQGTFTTVNTPYPTQLSQISGYVVYNGGVGSQTTAQIASRMLFASDKYSWPTIIWAGRNDISGNISTDEPNILNGIASMVAALQSVGNNNYIILSIINTNLEPSGNANYNEIISINSTLSSTYGSHYLDVREYLVQNGLSVAGITPSAQDLTDISNDVVPTDLRYDFLHLNTAGYGVVAEYVDANITLLNSNYFLQASSVVTPNDLRQALGTFNSGLYIGDNRALYANSTNGATTGITLVGVGAGFTLLSTSSLDDIAIGFQSLYNATSSNYNTAIGALSLNNDTSGSTNEAMGYTALFSNTTGSGNVALGHGSMYGNTTGGNNVASGINSLSGNSTGSGNVAIGNAAMYGNSTGSNNVGIGQNAFYNNHSPASSVAIGYAAAQGGGSGYSNQGGVYIGFDSGFSATTSSNYNTLLGYQSGFDVSTGADNIMVGPEIATGGNHLTTGGNNIGIGYNLVFPGGSNAFNQLNIGNLIFGTALNSTSTLGGTSIPATLTGNLAIGTSTPYSRLEVWGPDTAAGTGAFLVANSASTTEFVVHDDGSATLAGTLTQNSDQRLKTNIEGLDPSSSLASIDALNPVTFNWIDPTEGVAPQLGFIAQQVQSVFPNLVSTTSATALTPGGTLGLNYIGLISPIVAAIQALDREVTSLASTVAGFAQSFTSNRITAAQELCVGSTCITEDQLKALLAGQSSPSIQISTPTIPVISTSTPPTIHLQGDNPATIHIGDTYTDLGAIVTDNQGHSLGYTTYLNGTLVSTLTLDTSTTTTDTIDYVATDTWGNTATSTRTVIIAPQNVASQ